MNYRGTIGISAMLVEIKANPEEPFTLEWWRVANEANLRKGKAGTVKRIAKAVYSAPKRQANTRTPGTGVDYAQKTSRNSADFRDTSQFPINDSEAMQFHTPLISHIKSYNGYKVKH